MFRFTTAGESHGRALVAVVEGVPAGLTIDVDLLDRELERRQWGYGRGGRMKIERDRAQILSGVRAGIATGAPVSLLIENKDWANWSDVMRVEPRVADESETDELQAIVTDGNRVADNRVTSSQSEKSRRVLHRPRPGHADLAGGLKFNQRDLRNVLERASARETAARVACGAIAKQLLREFDCEVRSHVVQLGGVPRETVAASWEQIVSIADDAPLRCADVAAQNEMVALIDEARSAGDTLGGVFEVVARGMVAGLGSHMSWDAKLDGRLAQAVMSIPAVKAVSIGAGVEASGRRGSQVHDEIGYNNAENKFMRGTNRAGGLEGGITNGEELRVRGFMKPISTLRKSLQSVDIETKQAESAAFERSDITAVPSAGVIAESMVALTIAAAMREKFGGDSIEEMRRNFDGYLRQLENY